MEPNRTDGAAPAHWSELPCGQCGATLKYQPGTESLRCEYCGHTQLVTQPGDIAEVAAHDLDEVAAGGGPGGPSHGPDARQLRCETCGAVTVLSGVADSCPFCGSPRVLVVAAEGGGAGVAPDGLLVFKIPKDRADQLFRQWVSGLWLAPRDLSRRAATHGLDGVFLPFWAFAARAVADYVGERGEHYTEVETFKDESGKEQKRKVRKTRWAPASGSVTLPFDDVLVCASRSLPQQLVDSLGPWKLDEVRPFAPEFVSGFKAERYSLGPTDAFELAKKTMEAPIRSAVKTQIGGDEQRVKTQQVRYEAVRFKHLLLPLWLASFRYGDRTYRVLVNAATGQVKGERPWSPAKVGATSVVALALAALLLWGVASWADCSCTCGEPAPRQGPNQRRRRPRTKTKTKQPRRQRQQSSLDLDRSRAHARASARELSVRQGQAPPRPVVRRDRLPRV